MLSQHWSEISRNNFANLIVIVSQDCAFPVFGIIPAREAVERGGETSHFSRLRRLAHFSENFLELFSRSQRRQYEGHCIEPEETWKSPTSSRPTPTLNCCDSQ